MPEDVAREAVRRFGIFFFTQTTCTNKLDPFGKDSNCIRDNIDDRRTKQRLHLVLSNKDGDVGNRTVLVATYRHTQGSGRVRRHFARTNLAES